MANKEQKDIRVIDKGAFKMKKNKKSLECCTFSKSQDKNGKMFVTFTVPPATSEKAVTKLVKDVNSGKSIADYQDLSRRYRR